MDLATQHKPQKSRNRTIGNLFIAIPFLFGVISAVLLFVSTILDLPLLFSPSDKAALAVASSVFGGIAAILIPLLIIGIIIRNRPDVVVERDDAFAGAGIDRVPPEIKGWNWGAAVFQWIWGAYYGVWISFLAFVPMIGMVWWIVLGFKGNEWAWKAREWESVDAFKRSQAKWTPWAFGLMAITLAGWLYVFLEMFNQATKY